MLDDSLTAEMVGVLLDGVRDGGEPKIDALYKKYDATFDASSITKFDKVLKYLAETFAPSLIDTPLLNPPHLLMLFSGIAYLLVGIPNGDMKQEELANLPKAMPKDLDKVRDHLLLLAALIDSDIEPGPPLTDFWKASRSSTQRIASRRVRFPVFVRMLGGSGT
jgi:hypothetical protein